MIVLGIETSCDDTSVCLIKAKDLETPPEVLALKLFSQETLLKKWGGVVPEIAARNHLTKLAPLLEELFTETKTQTKDIDAIGVTTHPGLLGPLLTGLNGAKTLSMINQTSIVPVNHIYAHIEAIHLTEPTPYPYVGLVVSGGHSLYLLVKSPYEFEMLGTTIDDASGEAFDKGGKLLGLGYPAGRIIDDLAKEGDKEKYEFPIGLKSSANANLSYSGLKTALRQWIENNGEIPKDQMLKDICASYQEAIVAALKLKARYAFKKARELTGMKDLPLVVGGGVACNSRLREVFKSAYQDCRFVQPKYCTDNGAMIANYAFRTSAQNMVEFPKTLLLDARGRFIDKNQLQQNARRGIK